MYAMSDFYKYHGLGNDFLIVEAHDHTLDRRWVERVCDRHRGVGADGVLLAAPPERADSHGRMVLYNQDGTRPEMCGNGIRCVARHLAEQRGIEDNPLFIDTDAGRKTCRIVSRESDAWLVSVDMGRAEFSSDPIDLDCEGVSRRFYRVDVGNPHAVTFEAADAQTVDRFGDLFNGPDAGYFDDGVNVEFVSVQTPDAVDVVVYERGVGRTQACGTGACATAVAGWRTERLADGPVDVALPGGTLEIEEDDDGNVWMTGPAEAVYSGDFAPGWQ